jgi:hypothetical protein
MLVYVLEQVMVLMLAQVLVDTSVSALGQESVLD